MDNMNLRLVPAILSMLNTDQIIIRPNNIIFSSDIIVFGCYIHSNQVINCYIKHNDALICHIESNKTFPSYIHRSLDLTFYIEQQTNLVMER